MLKRLWIVEEASEMSPPVVKVCNPVHVGTSAWSIAGAPSERMKVTAEPFTIAVPTDAVGFAPTGAAISAAQAKLPADH